ncbi:MAG: head-tail connector protein [Gallionella sp.]|jgi:uncharacterized phiE125 gp8 family phage protein
MPLITITAPATEPVSLAEARLHLKVDSTDDDTLISALITAVREQAEHRTGRAFITQTLELVLDSFPAAFELPQPPALAITSVKYYDTNGALQTMAASLYSLDSDSAPARLVPAYGEVWPATYGIPNAVRVRYTAGYGAAGSDVPGAAKAWILCALTFMYDNRGMPLPRDFMSGTLDSLVIGSRLF